MSEDQKVLEIKSRVKSMMENVINNFDRNVDKIIKSGAIDIDGYDADCDGMLLPRAILIAILRDESDSRIIGSPRMIKTINKEAKNLQHFL